MKEMRDSLDFLPARPSRWQSLKDWVKRDTRSTDWLIVLLTAAIALTSVLQWHEIRAGSSDTHTLAVAAKTQAEKMASMSDAAEKIRQAAQDMVAQDQRIADNAGKSLDASSKQSRDALNVTVNNAKRDQRAWIGIRDFRVVQFEKDKSLKIDIDFTNSGKTPAIHVKSYTKYGFVGGPIVLDGPLPEWVQSPIFENSQAVAPQGIYTTHLEIPSDVIVPRYDLVDEQRQIVYVFGEIDYTDLTRSPGVTTFCLFMDAQSKTLAYTKEFNDLK